MKPQHLALGVLIAAIWGFNFIPIKVALESFPPFLLVALRFMLAGLPVFFLPRPDLPLRRIFLIALPMFLFQYIFLFSALKTGMTPGIASITVQTQVVFTMLVGFLLLREKPTSRQLAGGAISLGGLGLIAFTIGGDVTLLGLLLTLCAAASWGTGTVLLRQSPVKNILSLMVWMSAAAALPALTVSLIFDGPHAIAHAITHAHLGSWAGLFFISAISTLMGFGLWGFLLRHYPAASVAPLGLLVPIFGALSAYLYFGERFVPLRLAGMALIMAGLAVTMLRKPARISS